MALPKKNVLRKKLDFDKVFKEGRAVKGSFLLIRYIKRDSAFSRFGVVVSTKVSKKAVRRNRLRRIIMEELRLKFPSMVVVDAVIMVSPRAEKITPNELREDLSLAVNKLR